jgi:hypothetical protein
MTNALFFGCWNEPGHYMFTPTGQTSYNHPLECPEGHDGGHLDGGYAPRAGYKGSVRGKAVCWVAQGGADQKARNRIGFDSTEHPQGHFLRHEHGGWTFISWWDRAQGDARSACNSTFLLKGSHTSDDMRLALLEHFPHVVRNLKRAGVELVEVFPIENP